jgi:dCTP deaminase
MILNDHEIIRRCAVDRLAEPFDIKNVNPASIDIRLGSLIMIESVNDDHYVALDISDYSRANPYELKPGHFVLASTLETFNIPEDLSGVFRLKSSLAREGLALCGAEFADPAGTIPSPPWASRTSASSTRCCCGLAARSRN